MSICKPLAYLFNLSLNESCFPSCSKEANVIPLFKKGESSAPNNYRHVSLLSCIGKLMERFIFKHMYNFLLVHNLIYKYQSGFQSGHSTVYQLYDKICKGFENREYTYMIFCDVSKAFDRVWHGGLIHKLQAYGFKNKIADWLKTYLSNRKQRVVVNSMSHNIFP